jgi:predicted nucleic acid-binding protein
MVLVDTSVWVDVFRDESGARRNTLAAALEGEPVVLTRFNELEMLQGCRDEREWSLLASYLEGQDYLDLSSEAWQHAARIYYDLRRLGRTVRSPIDCCIAQAAMEHDGLLLHRDTDFETISRIRPLRQIRILW